MANPVSDTLSDWPGLNVVVECTVTDSFCDSGYGDYDRAMLLCQELEKAGIPVGVQMESNIMGHEYCVGIAPVTGTLTRQVNVATNDVTFIWRSK